MDVSDSSLLSNDDIDSMLLAHVREHWSKTALIISEAMGAFDSWDEDRITQRMKALVEQGKIESAGDIQRWRFSEVRLPPRART